MKHHSTRAAAAVVVGACLAVGREVQRNAAPPKNQHSLGCAALLFALGSLLPISSIANESGAGYRADYERVSSGSIVQDKNFYVLTLLQHDPKVRAELLALPVLAAVGKDTSESSDESDESISPDLKPAARLAARGMMFSDEEINVVRSVLARQLNRSAVLRALVRDHLRPSGTYERLSHHSDAEMLSEAWAEAAQGINHVIVQFALPTDVPDVDIDLPSYDLEDVGYQAMILDARVSATHSRPPHGVLFFEPSLDFALSLLAINHRDEAARHEPLALLENRAAMERMRNMSAREWGGYPYAALLVHGIGPNAPGIAISAASRQNSAAAAALFHQKVAPFIIVSGGYVHPKQTIFSEAIEMKRQLMLVHAIPNSAILIEPHARHTTTNVRNSARILFAGRAPSGKPSLSVSTKEHIDGILSEAFAKRCERELGYLPAKYGKRLSEVAAEFIPSVESLQIDPRDPLDP